MGATPHINADAFPKQGAYIGKRVKVCYNDTTEPGLMIIHTDDGRALLSTECMWSPIKS